MVVGPAGPAIRNREPTGRRHGPRPIPGRGSRDHRPARRPSAGDFQSFTGVDRTHQSRETSPAGRDHRDPFGGVARYSDRGDFLPGYEASGWQGIGAPRNTPAEIIDKLNKEIGFGLADPKIKARIAELGGTVPAGSPADFGKRVSEDVEKWAKVIKFAHIKSD